MANPGAGKFYRFGPAIVPQADNFTKQLNYNFTQLTGARLVLPNAAYPGNIFYVGTNGADVPASSGGGTAAAPWLTPAYAASQLASSFDFGGQTVTLQFVSGHGNFTTALTISPWSGGGQLVIDFNSGSIITTNGSALIGSGSFPGLVTLINGTLGATGAQFAAAIDMHTGGGQLQVSNFTFNPCTFAYVWGSSLGGCVPSTTWVDSISLATNTALSPAQTCAVFSGGAGTFAGGFIRTCVVKATGNLAFSTGFSIQTIAIATFQGAGGAAATWLLNGHTVTYPNANVANVSGQGLSDFAGFH